MVDFHIHSMKKKNQILISVLKRHTDNSHQFWNRGEKWTDDAHVPEECCLDLQVVENCVEIF